MQRLIRLFLIGICCATWLGWPSHSYAQPTTGSTTIPSATFATDGEFVAWTVPANGNSGVSMVYARELTAPQAQPTLITSENIAAITTLLLSDGILVWQAGADGVRQTLHGRNLRGGDTFTIADNVYQPTFLGTTLFWWDLSAGTEPNGSATITRRNLRTLAAPEPLFQISFSLLLPGPLRVSERWLAWTQQTGLSYAAAVWSLYALPIGGSTAQLIKADIGCRGSPGYDVFALDGDQLIYSTGSCYRGPGNDGKLTILDLARGESQVSGPHGNASLMPAGRFILWNKVQQNGSELWGFDPHTMSAFLIGSALQPVVFRNGIFFWSKVENTTTTLAWAPLRTLLPSAPRPADDPALAGRSYFPETGHSLGGEFRSYWSRNGGLAVFGFPLSEEFIQQSGDAQQGYPVQYFERQRFEYHSENAGTPYAILLGRLGAEALAASGRAWEHFPKAQPTTPHYFAETGQAIAPEFWEYWRSHGLEFGDPGVSQREALALWGLPISPPMQEQLETGETLLVQWFERARFEYHPNNPAPYKVLLGRLAVETVERFGWR